MANLKPNLPTSQDTLKRLLRKRLKTIRQELSSARWKEASDRACDKLLSLTYPFKFVLSFASFGSEINLWPLNQELANEKRLILPRLSDLELHLYQVQDLNHLEQNHWGVLEPIPSLCTLIDLSLIDIALIPALGFDIQTKHRLGYGRGYYDRLLSVHPHAQTWGIGFLEQAIEEMPYSPQDIFLKQIYLF